MRNYTFSNNERQGWIFNNNEGQFSASITGFDIKAEINHENIQSMEDIHAIANEIGKNALQMLKIEFEKNI